ncbi:hypothetical protein TSC_c07400 [Thermus scotoductus SA-01]|uniref:Uncharacterized protein n=1 Tax=Thermus scotoductus (strain ATCC 700910 / SA-01) TaxID=743525 RepID=E8PN16_THESS|nr:hypothetical protein TSC_c07400 [Thermus scotoductus SA-01]
MEEGTGSREGKTQEVVATEVEAKKDRKASQVEPQVKKGHKDILGGLSPPLCWV